MLIGVISDTHGLLRQEVHSLFSNVDIILHAGDIGNLRVISELNNIAETVAVLGNTDKEYSLMREFKNKEFISLQGRLCCIIHNIELLDINEKTVGVNIIIHGHTHRPEIHYKEGVLYFNPGSAGPKRTNLPVSVGIIDIQGDSIKPKLIEIVKG